MKRYRALWLLIPGLILTVGLSLGQGPSGFTKVATVQAPTITYTDTTCVDGTACQWAVTAVNAAGESGSSNIAVGVIPATGTHSTVLTWVAPTTGGPVVSYNVYMEVLAKPGPPSGCTETVN